MPTLLVVDDEPAIAYSLKDSLETSTLSISTTHTARDGISFIRERRPDVVLLDVRLPDMSGLDAYDQIRKFEPRLPVIIMTAYARSETAIEATRRGAFDYLIKPVDFGQLKESIHRALEVSRLNRVPAVLTPEEDSTESPADLIVGLSPPMQEIYKAIGRVASQDATVLIVGESGTGKELVARAIYHYSHRNTKPFLAINCAALPETLLESELFGHERGAFTGADQRRIGKFEQVSGGTIFLDEIGDMSPATQAKALRLLQEQQFERLGGNTTIQTDVRVIAATNRNITQMVAKGNFRRDLFYRFNGITITLPPLRERPSDIPLLARHFIKLHSAETGISAAGITDEALAVLQSHDWPGNVREFQSAIKYALIHAAGAVITADCLPETCRAARPTGTSPAQPPSLSATTENTLLLPSSEAATPPEIEGPIVRLTKRLLAEGSTNLYRQVISEVDRIVLGIVLDHVSSNQHQAAEILGLSRMTLRTKLKGLRASGFYNPELADPAEEQDGTEDNGRSNR